MKKLVLLAGLVMLSGCGGDWQGGFVSSDSSQQEEQPVNSAYMLDATGMVKAFDLTQWKVSQDSVNALVQVNASVTNVGQIADIAVSVVGTDAAGNEVTNTAIMATVNQSETKSVFKQYLVPLNTYSTVTSWKIKKVTIL